jgi:hypothetical protein
MEEKKLLAKLNAFALHHTVCTVYTNYVKDKKYIDYYTVYTILYTVLLRELQKVPLFWMSAGK